jgi:hypothetical protein
MGDAKQDDNNGQAANDDSESDRALADWLEELNQIPEVKMDVPEEYFTNDGFTEAWLQIFAGSTKRWTCSHVFDQDTGADYIEVQTEASESQARELWPALFGFQWVRVEYEKSLCFRHESLPAKREPLSRSRPPPFRELTCSSLRSRGTGPFKGAVVIPPAVGSYMPPVAVTDYAKLYPFARVPKPYARAMNLIKALYRRRPFRHWLNQTTIEQEREHQCGLNTTTLYDFALHRFHDLVYFCSLDLFRGTSYTRWIQWDTVHALRLRNQRRFPCPVEDLVEWPAPFVLYLLDRFDATRDMYKEVRGEGRFSVHVAQDLARPWKTRRHSLLRCADLTVHTLASGGGLPADTPDTYLFWANALQHERVVSRGPAESNTSSDPFDSPLVSVPGSSPFDSPLASLPSAMSPSVMLAPSHIKPIPAGLESNPITPEVGLDRLSSNAPSKKRVSPIIQVESGEVCTTVWSDLVRDQSFVNTLVKDGRVRIDWSERLGCRLRGRWGHVVVWYPLPAVLKEFEPNTSVILAHREAQPVLEDLWKGPLPVAVKTIALGSLGAAFAYASQSRHLFRVYSMGHAFRHVVSLYAVQIQHQTRQLSLYMEGMHMSVSQWAIRAVVARPTLSHYWVWIMVILEQALAGVWELRQWGLVHGDLTARNLGIVFEDPYFRCAWMDLDSTAPLGAANKLSATYDDPSQYPLPRCQTEYSLESVNPNKFRAELYRLGCLAEWLLFDCRHEPTSIVRRGQTLGSMDESQESPLPNDPKGLLWQGECQRIAARLHARAGRGWVKNTMHTSHMCTPPQCLTCTLGTEARVLVERTVRLMTTPLAQRESTAYDVWNDMKHFQHTHTTALIPLLRQARYTELLRSLPDMTLAFLLGS